MKRYLFTAVACFIALASWAKGSVSGTVFNAATNEPIDYAMVQLLDSKGKPLTIGGYTDDKGTFSLAGVPDGKYIIRISNLGNVPQERDITIAGDNVSIGNIKLASDTKMLQEVVVEGNRSNMKFELDRKVFTVDADVASAGASASELLESIPSVEVDQDGEVSLRGDSSVTVWINGKESGLTADNRAQILEQIPAETIEQIEVITNPSAKYSPEGTAGIINIVLKNNRKAGYFGSAEIGASTKGDANASFSFNYNSSRWESYASIGWRMRHNKRSSYSHRYYDNGNFLNNDGENRNHGNNIFVRLGATYHPTLNDDIYINGFGMFGHRWGHKNTLYTSNLPGQWISNTQLTRQNNDMRGLHAELGYTHRWSKTHTIDGMIGFNHWGGPMWNSYLYHEDWAADADGNMPETTDLYQEQSQNIKSNSVNAKLDYSLLIAPWMKLEAGYQGDYSHENSPVSTLSTKGGNFEIDPLLYNRFIYNNNISAFYLTLGGKLKDFSYSAGLRAEAWQVRAWSLTYGQLKQDVTPYKNNDFALFPSLFLSYSLPYDNEVQVNVTRRIQRPWGGQLNSFRNISDPTNISYGNEELQPQYSYSFELNYIKMFTEHVISLSAYLRTTDDVMSRISYFLPADPTVMYTTNANVSKSVSTGAEIVVKNNLFRNVLNLTTTFNLYNYHLDAWSINFHDQGQVIPVSGSKQDNFAWDVRCMAGVKLPWGISFQATGRYNSRQHTPQGSREPGWSVDAGLRKTAGNWSFAVNWRDIFNSRKWNNITYGDGYWQQNESKRIGSNIRFTIKYSFGNMKGKQKNNRQNEEPIDNSGYGSGEME